MSRALRMASALALVVSGAGTAVFAPSASAAPSGDYYVAMGDSLAAGYQPGAGDDKTGGYVGGVLAHLKQTDPGVQLENLACSGETTGTMLKGGKCSYPEGNQVAAAVAFLKAHPQVTLMTLDIGANNVQTCVDANGINLPCVAQGMKDVAADLPSILGKLRAAAPNARIVVVNYYNPFLAAWLLGAPGESIAKSSVALQEQLNGIISGAGTAAGAPTADVATAFSSTDFTDMVKVDPFGEIPLNVARICQWTWMCSKANIHANDAGYAVMAKAVIAAIPAAAPTSPTSSPTSSASSTATETTTSKVTGPPIVTDGGASGGSNESVLIGAGVMAVGLAAVGGGAFARTRRRRD